MLRCPLLPCPRRFPLAAVAMLAALALAACGKPPTGVPEVPTAPPTAGEDTAAQVEGFALVSARAEQHEGQLALSLGFSRPLTGSQDFDALLAVRRQGGEAVNGSWALDEDARTLRFPFIKADTHYNVALKAGLTAVDGSTLGETSRDVYTGPLAPVVGFAAQGSVLPARDTRGLPVVSVNVREVDVEFLRVRDGEVANFFAAYQKNGKRSSWDLDPRYGWYQRGGKPVAQIADSVYANRFLLSGKDNERSLDYLPIQNIDELARPGLYFATLKRAGSFSDEYETSFFFVSDIGVHTRAYKDSMFVHAASLKSGEAMAGVEFQVIDAGGNAIARSRADESGNAMLAYTLDAAHVLVARSGRDVSYVPFNQPALDLSEFAVAGRKQAWFDVFAWSGRDLYRPGETVRLSALLRDFDGRPIKPQPLFLTLRQPDGRLFAEARIEPGELGYFEWSREIPPDAPTGRWQVEFRTDPKSSEISQSISLRIEEFLPERLKLELASAQATLQPGEPLRLEVQGDYLYGAPAAGNRFTARLTVLPDVHPVEAEKDFFYGDPLIELPKEAKDIIDGKLDDDGHASESITLFDAAAPKAPVLALVAGSVHETGGRTVTRTLKRTMWPAAALVGVRPLFDPKEGADANARAAFEVIRSNAAGERIAGSGLELRLVRERRDYHWVWDNESGWRFNYKQSFQDLETRTLEVEAGKATRFDVPVEWGGYRIEIEDPATGLVLRFPFRAGWSWDDDNRGSEARPDKVKLALDKTSYRAGDTLKVTLTPPHAGPGVLIVEADRMLYTRNIDARAGATFEIPVTGEWERHDVYLTALVFRGGSAAERITPARAVGAAFVPIDRRERTLEARIEVPALMKPQTDLPVKIEVPALAGRKAYVTVSAVDVGILNITRFPVPDANGWFFAQRRLGIDARDLYGRVIESYDGGLARLRYGGDMALDALPQARRPTAKVLTVDLFSGAVALDADGKAQLALAVPDFNGSLRVSALVYAEDRYGKAEAETVVRAPLVAEISTPRVMAPGDRSAVALDLANHSGGERTFKVRVTGEGPLAVRDGERRVTLADTARTTLNVPLEAREGYGVGRIHIRAESTDDGEPIRIDRSFEMVVRAGWPAVLRSTTQSLDALAPVSLGAGTLEGLVAESVTARLTVSSLPPLPFASALDGLLRYPYGCVEQTTSKGFAALLLDESTAQKLHVSGLDAAQRRERVEGAIGRIASMQAGSGHYSFWGGDSGVNTFLTPYITEFLLDARDEGFNVPEAMLQKSLERLSEDLLSGGHPYYAYDESDHLRFADQAWSAYVLARVKRAPLGTLRALFDNERGKSKTALPLVHLGIALKLMGDEPRALKAIEEAFAKKSERPRWLGDYGSELRDGALMIALVQRHGMSKPEYGGRVFDLARMLKVEQRQAEQYRWNINGRLYLSTQEQIAIARLGKGLIADGDALVSGTLAVGAQSTEVLPDRIWSRSFDAAALRAGVRMTPRGTPPLYVSTDVAGVPRTAPAVDDSSVAIVRSWYTLDGKPWQVAPLREGDSLVVGLRIEAREAMPDALLIDLLPGGLEIENFNLTDAAQWADVVVDGITLSDRSSAAEVRHEEFRDDRYVAALALERGQRAHVFYLVRAVSPGSFLVPPPLVEDMYRPGVRGIGRSSVTSIQVVQP